MKERPIIFNGEMVRAILAGRKSQTRRVVKPLKGFSVGAYEQGGTVTPVNVQADGDPWTDIKCPYQIGDHLYVRENWCQPIHSGCGYHHKGYDYKILYAADDGLERFPVGGNWTQYNHDFKWRPSIHMPKRVARIWLEVTDIRFGGVKEISHEDAEAEGIQFWIDGFKKGPVYHNNSQLRNYPVTAFGRLWDSINADRGYGFDDNCGVWIYNFKQIEKGPGTSRAHPIQQERKSHER